MPTATFTIGAVSGNAVIGTDKTVSVDIVAPAGQSPLPADFTITASVVGNDIQVNWSAVTNAYEYRVLFGLEGEEGTFTEAQTTVGALVSSLPVNGTYMVTVEASNSEGRKFSNTVGGLTVSGIA